MFNVVKILILILFATNISFAEILDFGEDFSSRSLILRQMSAKNEVISQELKDILKERKLSPSINCLLEQIDKGNYENVKLLLDAKVNPNEEYMTIFPLYYACKKDNYEIAKLLIEHGAKLNKSMDSELYEAVKNKNQNLAILLIENGANVNYSTPLTIKTILYMSLKNKMYDVSRLLIEKGAKADDRSVKYIHKHELQYLIPQ